MACLDDNELSGFVQGRLEAAQREEVERHIDVCQDCRVLLSALGQIAGEPSVPLKLVEIAEPGVPTPGDVIAGKYKVERMVGVGGMGVVVAATHLDLQQTVALKFMRPSVLSNPSAVRRFLAEARAVVRLKSGHVGRVLDLGKLDTGSPYIVMEYLEGIDLDRLVTARGPLSVELSVQYVLQALDAVAEAHAAGIVHRDLKPANLFLTTGPDGSAWIKVLDFGVSKYSQPAAGALEATDARTVLGSPLYMSPEQLRSAAAVDARSDIWSLGCTLYHLVCGRTPFDEPSLAELTASIMNGAPRPLRAVPAAYAAIVDRCLEKDPAKRPQDVAELARALSSLVPALAARPVRAPKPAFLGGHPRAIAAAAGVVLISGMVIARWSRGPAHKEPASPAPESVAEALAPPPLDPVPPAQGAPPPPQQVSRVIPPKAVPGHPRPKLIEAPKRNPAEDDILGSRK